MINNTDTPEMDRSGVFGWLGMPPVYMHPARVAQTTSGLVDRV